MATFRKLVASTLTTDFRKACQIVNDKIDVLKPHEVLVKARYSYIYDLYHVLCQSGKVVTNSCSASKIFLSVLNLR